MGGEEEEEKGEEGEADEEEEDAEDEGEEEGLDRQDLAKETHDTACCSAPSPCCCETCGC